MTPKNPRSIRYVIPVLASQRNAASSLTKHASRQSGFGKRYGRVKAGVDEDLAENFRRKIDSGAEVVAAKPKKFSCVFSRFDELGER